MDAIAQSGGVGQFNISYIYVSREITGEEAIIEQVGELEQLVPEQPAEEAEREAVELRSVGPDGDGEGWSHEEGMLGIMAAYAKGVAGDGGIIIALSEMITYEEVEALATPEGLEPETKSDVDDEAKPAEEVEDSVGRGGGAERIEWVFEDGRWLPIRVGPAPEVERREARRAEEFRGPLPFDKETAERFGLEQIGTAGAQVRIIKIPVDKLLGGDPRYNIMIRSGDSITVPADLIGEFWVMGNVRGSGPINLTGRPMTVQMALATAGGRGSLVWPKNVEVNMRVGQNKEVTVMVNLDKIAKGLQPDFFIKPYDLINVGTHGTSRFTAVLRNAFSANYGFSFSYGRNFARRDFYSTYQTVQEGFEEFLNMFE